jgi:lipopolysaccharide transport system permease protein
MNQLNHNTQEIKVYTPSSPIGRPLELLTTILQDLWKYRDLSWLLFSRDIKAQFRQSYFGYLWLLLPILSTTLTWIFLESNKLVNITRTELPYPLFVLVGTLIWTSFSSAINTPLSSFQASQNIFMKLNLSPEIFIVAGLYKLLFDISIRTAVIIPLCMMYNILPFRATIVLPAILGITVLLGISIGFLLLTLGSLYHDFSRFTSLALGFGMYLTPIVYPPPTSGPVCHIINLNPITPLVAEARSAFIDLPGQNHLTLILITLISACILIINALIFRSTLPNLTERMGM